jgi:serine/threonine protein kinase
MELMECDLQRIISSDQVLSEEHFKCFMKQILEAIKALHQSGILHRDLKPSNIVVSKNCHLRIADFGLARCLPTLAFAETNSSSTDVTSSSMNPMTHFVVTTWYRSPELLLSPLHIPYSTAIDIWSVGCVFGELMLRKVLFPGRNHANQIQSIFSILGPISFDEETLGFPLTDEMKTFLRTKIQYRKQPFAHLIPEVSDTAIELLERLLTVNPHTRITAQVALQSSFFQGTQCFFDYRTNYLPHAQTMQNFFQFENQINSLEMLQTMISVEVDELSASKYRSSSSGSMTTSTLTTIEKTDSNLSDLTATYESAYGTSHFLAPSGTMSWDTMEGYTQAAQHVQVANISSRSLIDSTTSSFMEKGEYEERHKSMSFSTNDDVYHLLNRSSNVSESTQSIVDKKPMITQSARTQQRHDNIKNNTILKSNQKSTQVVENTHMYPLLTPPQPMISIKQSTFPPNRGLLHSLLVYNRDIEEKRNSTILETENHRESDEFQLLQLDSPPLQITSKTNPDGKYCLSSPENFSPEKRILTPKKMKQHSAVKSSPLFSLFRTKKTPKSSFNEDTGVTESSSCHISPFSPAKNELRMFSPTVQSPNIKSKDDPPLFSLEEETQQQRLAESKSESNQSILKWKPKWNLSSPFKRNSNNNNSNNINNYNKNNFPSKTSANKI